MPQRRWDDFDTALTEAVYNVATGPLLRDLFQYQQRRAKLGYALLGRAVLWHMYQRFMLNKDSGIEVFDNTLVHMEVHRDLEGFLGRIFGRIFGRILGSSLEGFLEGCVGGYVMGTL